MSTMSTLHNITIENLSLTRYTTRNFTTMKQHNLLQGINTETKTL